MFAGFATRDWHTSGVCYRGASSLVRGLMAIGSTVYACSIPADPVRCARRTSEERNHCILHASDICGFDAKKSQWAHDAFDVVLRSGRQSCGIGIFEEQFRRGLVHSFVGTLRGQNRGHKQLKRRFMVQCALGFGVNLLQNLDHGFRALLSFIKQRIRIECVFVRG